MLKFRSINAQSRQRRGQGQVRGQIRNKEESLEAKRDQKSRKKEEGKSSLCLGKFQSINTGDEDEGKDSIRRGTRDHTETEED